METRIGVDDLGTDPRALVLARDACARADRGRGSRLSRARVIELVERAGVEEFDLEFIGAWIEIGVPFSGGDNRADVRRGQNVGPALRRDRIQLTGENQNRRLALRDANA